MDTIVALIKNVGLILGSGLFLYVGYYLRKRNAGFIKKGVKTKATITGFSDREMNIGGETNPAKFPIVQFTNEEGETITQELNSYDTRLQTKGEVIDICYIREEDGYDILIRAELWLTYMPLIFTLIGILLLAIGSYRLLTSF